MPNKKDLITIELEKFSELTDKIEDMVITNSMITQTIENMPNNNDKGELLTKTTLFQRHIKELQDIANNLRLVYLEDVFMEITKEVNDYAIENKKIIQFKNNFNKTKIDKTTIDSLKKPLIVAIKSIIDRFDPTNSTNKRIIKPFIVINAKEANGEVIVDIVDNAKPLNQEAIVLNALSKESINDTDIDILCDDKKLNLHIHSDEIAPIEKIISKLKGNIRFSIQNKKENKLTLSIPLFQAIVDGLNVLISNDLFIIPTNFIIESIQPKEEMIKEIACETGDILMLRDDFIPIINLNKLFNLKENITNLTEGMMIIVSNKEKKLALFIDKFEQQQQIVIKPIDYNYKQVDYFSGAIVRGDGTVGLVIDIKSIFNKFNKKDS